MKILWFIAILLLLFIMCVKCWYLGFSYGYSEAMADVVLHYETPENFFIKKFDIHTPPKQQLKQEQK